MTAKPRAGRDAALAAYQRGDAAALALLDAALTQAPLDGGLLIAQARARAETGRGDAAAGLAAMLARAPDWVDGHVALAQLRWAAGERDRFLDAIETSLRRAPDQPALWLRYIGLLAGSGALSRAADVARDLRGRTGDPPALRLIEARHAGAAGDHARAGALLDALPATMPERGIELARHRLRTGDIDAAVALLDAARAAPDPDPAAWPLTELAWRASGDPRHAWLVADGRLVHAAPVIGDLRERGALAEILRALHRTAAHPLGQSIRHGTQTRGDLALRREPEIVRLFAAFHAVIADYLAGLPPADPAHPLLARRDRAHRIVSAWSIRIVGAGFHVSHFHPGGTLSSACHIVVPDGLDADAREGWLELGRPPEDIPLALEPLASIAPRPGWLVLFPGLLYHGTRPFAAGERLTVAFDAGADQAATAALS